MTRVAEVWHTVLDTMGYYSVSSYGRIRSNRPYRGKPAGAIRQLTLGNHGYLVISLTQGGKKVTRLVHAIVAEAFIGLCPLGQEVRHLDGDKTNCASDNLSYGTRVDNEKDKVIHGRSNRGERCATVVLNQGDVIAIRDKRAHGFSYGELADEWGVSRSTIQHVCERNTWKHI